MAYRLLALLASQCNEGVMAFFVMKAKKMSRRQDFPALDTPIGVGLIIMRFELLVRFEGEAFPVWR